MNRNEQLIIEYENAYFALLMDAWAEHEGKKLIEENNKLINDPTFEVPASVHKRSMDAINRAFRRKKAIAALRNSKHFVSKIAVVFLIASILFTTAYASVPQFRTNVLGLLIRVSDISTTFIMDIENTGAELSSPAHENTLLGYTLPKIPAGYELLHEDYSDGFSASVYYLNPDNDYIAISVTAGNGTTYNIDTEDADSIAEINVDGFPALLVNKDGDTYITMADTDNGYLISIFSSSLNEKELLQMLHEMR